MTDGRSLSRKSLKSLVQRYPGAQRWSSHADDRAEAVDRCELHLGGLMLAEVVVKKAAGEAGAAAERGGSEMPRNHTGEGVHCVHQRTSTICYFFKKITLDHSSFHSVFLQGT